SARSSAGSSSSAIGTGRWYASRTLRSSISSSGSAVTPDLLELRAQRVASSLHAHLERRNSGSGDSRDLAVLEAFAVLQEKRLPEERIQRVQRGLKRVADLGARLVGVAGGPLGRARVVHETPAQTAAPAAERATLIHQDTIEPSAEHLPLLIA